MDIKNNSGRKILIVHSEGNVNNNPNLSGLVEILCEHGYAVDIASPRRKQITQRSPHPNARLLLTDNPSGLHGGEFVLLDRKPLSTPEQIAEAVEGIGNYDFIFGVDRAIIEAAIIANAKAIPCGLISYEIYFEEETDCQYKRPEQLACEDIIFAVCPDGVRAEHLCRENQIPIEKIIKIPVAGRGCVQRNKSFMLHDKLGIERTKKIAIYTGSVSAFCMTEELIDSAAMWPDNWVLVVHNRYGVDKRTELLRQKYAQSKKVLFSTEPVESPCQMHTLLNCADIGVALYKPLPSSKLVGNNIRYIGLSSGKIATYLQHGLPVLVNEIGIMSDCVRRYNLGMVHSGPLPIRISEDLIAGQQSRNASQFFAEYLDLNKAAVPLLRVLDGAIGGKKTQGIQAKWINANHVSDSALPLTEIQEFTYSRQSHFKRFAGYDVELYGKQIDPQTSRLKVYQDLLVFAFIKNHIPIGSRLLDVGGADSRILKHFCKDYECWNIDKLDGLGDGCKSLDTVGRYRLVQDYMGNFNKELPDNYFDFVFSISALEHTLKTDPQSLAHLRDDLNRVLKPGGYSLHCFDIIIKPDTVWTNPLLPMLFETQLTLNHWIPLELLQFDPDLYVLPESVYNRSWIQSCRLPYQEFGKPVSYNILWQKAPVTSRLAPKAPTAAFENQKNDIAILR